MVVLSTLPPSILSRSRSSDDIFALTDALSYHLSDVGLAKICTRHQIPRPSVGYWAQIQHGHTPRRLALPPATDQTLEIVEITIRDLSVVPSDPEFRTRAGAEKAAIDGPDLKIVVQQSLGEVHPMVQCALKSYENAKAKESGVLVPRDPATLDIRVTSSCLRRALRIWNALIPAFESRGYSVEIQKQEPNATVITVLGEPIPICVMEEIECTVREATPDEVTKRRRQRIYDTKVNEYKPTGRLVLKMEVRNGYGLRQRWSDSARQKVDDRLAGFVHGLVDMAIHIRADRMEAKPPEFLNDTVPENVATLSPV